MGLGLMVIGGYLQFKVASGLPVRNGDKHAVEIATMALDLLSGSTTFVIPHRKEEKLQVS